MNRHRALVVISLFLGLAGGVGASHSAERQLVNSYRSFHKARDLAGMTKLVHWQGVDKFTRDTVLRSIKSDFGQRIKQVCIKPVPKGQVFEYKVNEKTYRPNLPVVGWLVVEFEKSPAGGQNGSRYLVGRSGGTLKIATAAAVK